MSKTGIMAGFLVCSNNKVLKDHALVVENGIITDIVPNSKVLGTPGFTDARDCIVTPGFVNAHTHMYGVISHGTPCSCLAPTLKPRLEQYWWPKVEDKINHELVDLSTKHACVEALRNGVTCWDDTLEAPNAVPGALAIEADIIDKAGLRAVLGFEATQRQSNENGLTGLKENYDFVKRQRAKKDSLVKGLMCAHTTFSCSTDFLRKAKEMANELNEDLQIHLCESVDEGRYCIDKYGKFPAELYFELGILDKRLLASQCVVMDPCELEMMGRAKVRVAHQPISNATSGNGIAPVREMINYGMSVGLGTDGEVGDMLEIMRTTYYIHKARRMTSVDVLSMKEIFAMATEMGADAIGYKNIGKFEIGRCADWLVFDTFAPTPVNENNIFSQIIMFRKSSNIKEIVVAGNTLMKNGSLLTVDEKRIEKDIYEATQEYWRNLV